MTQHDGDALPLLDNSVLERLHMELDHDEGVWKVFIRDFVAHLPFRLERVRLALTTGDTVAAKDAVLSLKTSSQMVGAERLAGLALDLEGALRFDSKEGDPSVVLPRIATAHLTAIRQCAEQTSYLLNRHLLQFPGRV
ncbi:Hpt domain-containing protein [Arthrobacter sp. ZGTC412]|uniref:Hpt domain-containing protein n=1 Tax=Arthrobacter sp. ZGTC412 TaxID=2058900 RepID=UPI000CE4BF32|nr:Hpt domain-containing protein [Arthrobacter sp. ZGTC412]